MQVLGLLKVGLRVSDFFFKLFNPILFSISPPLSLLYRKALPFYHQKHTHRHRNFSSAKTFLFPHLKTTKQNNNSEVTSRLNSQALIFFNHLLVSQRNLQSPPSSGRPPLSTSSCTQMTYQPHLLQEPLFQRHKPTSTAQP